MSERKEPTLDPEWITVEQAARQLHIGPRAFLNAWKASGRAYTKPTYHARLVRRDELEAFLKEREKK